MKHLIICVILALCLSAFHARAAEPAPAAKPAVAETPEEAEAKRKKILEQFDQLEKDLDAMNKALAPAASAVSELQTANDTMMIMGLTGLHMRKSMMELCKITGPDADKLRAREDADIKKFSDTLTEQAKKNYPANIAEAEAALKADWDANTEEAHTKECDAIKAAIAKEVANEAANEGAK